MTQVSPSMQVQSDPTQFGQPVMQQPIIQQPVQQTTVVVANMGGNQVPQGPRYWRSGPCACFEDMGSCIMVGVLSLLGLAECYGCHLSMRMNESCCLCCCVQGYLTALRTKLRAENNIQGSICDDCIMTSCCRPCVMCQMSRELDYLR